MSRCTARCVPDDYEAGCEQAVTDDPALAVIATRVFDLDSRAGENQSGILEIKPALI